MSEQIILITSSEKKRSQLLLQIKERLLADLGHDCHCRRCNEAREILAEIDKVEKESV